MFKSLTFLKQARMSLIVGGISWVSLAGLLLDMAHLAWLLALSLSFFPSLFILWAVRSFSLKSQRIVPVPVKLKRFVQETGPEPLTVSHPHLERFLADFSDILEMQKQYWETKTTLETGSVASSGQEGPAFSLALKDYGHQKRTFTLWQNYKQSVLEILRVGNTSSLGKEKEISVAKLRYRLSERELYLSCHQAGVRDAIEEVQFFLQAIQRREKELEEIMVYLDKVAADGIWLSADRKQKVKEYQKSKEICQKQLEIDTEEMLRNLEEIFISL